MSVDSAPRTSRRSAAAFTLMELLVVVGIIALLAALITPSLAKAKERARSSACASNLKSIIQSYIMYCTDKNDGKANITSTARPGTFWMYLTQEYHSNDNRVYICPAAQSPAVLTLDDANVQWGSATGMWDGYANNGRWIKWVQPNKMNPAYVGANNPEGLVGKIKTTAADDDLANGSTRNRDIGYTSSYGNNSWIDNNSTPNQAIAPGSSKIKFIGQVTRQDTVFFVESSWANTSGSNPNTVLYSSPAGPIGSSNIYPGYIDMNADLNSGHSSDSISRVLLKRHGKAINISYGDGSASETKLMDIWKVAWFNGWQNTDGPASIINAQ